MIRPNQKHLYKNLIIGNDGNNANGKSWLDHNDDFVTANANDLYRYFNAPKGKEFRVYSVHFYAMTVHYTNKSTDQTKPGELNLDMNLDRLDRPSFPNFSRGSHIAHCRMYLWKVDNTAITHDANDNDTFDSATDHWNPNTNREIRTYDPFAYWSWPHGIDVGSYLGFIVAHGGRKKFTGLFRWRIFLSLYDRIRTY